MGNRAERGMDRPIGRVEGVALRVAEFLVGNVRQ